MCECCEAARLTTGHWRYYELQCLWCGARLIQRIGRLQVMPSEIKQRRQAVLKDWMAWGHSEQELRDLVKGPMAVEPVQKTTGRK
jgi:hypothetical protein